MMCTLGWVTLTMVVLPCLISPGFLDALQPMPIGTVVNPIMHVESNGMRTCMEMVCGMMLETLTLTDRFGLVTKCSVAPVK